jgi:hypothetical protein
MGFRNAGGEEVYFEVPDFAPPVPATTAPRFFVRGEGRS